VGGFAAGPAIHPVARTSRHIRLLRFARVPKGGEKRLRTALRRTTRAHLGLNPDPEAVLRRESYLPLPATAANLPLQNGAAESRQCSPTR